MSQTNSAAPAAAQTAPAATVQEAHELLREVVQGRRLSREQASAVFAALGAFLVAALLAFADWLRPAESRTHLGKFVQQVLDGDGLGVVGDKLGANLKLVFGTPFSPLVPIALIALIWIVAKPTSKPGAALDVALRSVPFARETLIGLLVLWTVGFAMNDSGLALLLNGIGLALPLAMTLAAHRLRRDQDHTIHI